MKKAASTQTPLNVVRQACSEGLGITLMPDVMIREYIEDGSLVQVLEDWSANRVTSTCFITTKTIYLKVRLFIDFCDRLPHSLG
ncbi:LysR substrate-binding domain-containing protein [Vibrio chagasii]|nr:LysR substrate-binding domain-containing protein [Vibrio chagasii]